MGGKSLRKCEVCGVRRFRRRYSDIFLSRFPLDPARYGLIKPEKVVRPVFQATRNVFGDDSDSDEEPNKKTVLLKPSHNINRQVKMAHNKAVVEDPTVFQYDEVYDSIKSEKKVTKDKSKEIKKPRYIENLMKSANKRKIENERRVERQIQKERELEGDEFADKEVFVTSAYKKKLEEMSLEEEKEKREEYLESIGDVTKQDGLGGFYRHLYEQKLGTAKDVDAQDTSNIVKENNDSELKSSTKSGTMLELTKKRNYRKRKSSSEIGKKQLSEGEVEDSDDEEINRLNLDDIKLAKKYKQNKDNLDADSDFSIDESSDDEAKTSVAEATEETLIKPKDKQFDDKESSINNDKKADKNTLEVKSVTESKPKINIWKKRTVGEVFEQALQRYYERKAARSL